MAQVISIVSDPKADNRPAIKINFDFGTFDPALPETVQNELVSHLRTRWIQSLETAKWKDENPEGRHPDLTDGMTVDVKTLLDERATTTRQELSKLDKTVKDAAKLSDEDKRQLIEALQKSLA